MPDDPIVIPGLTRESAQEAEAFLHAQVPGKWTVEIQPQTDGTFTLVATLLDEQGESGITQGDELPHAGDAGAGRDVDDLLQGEDGASHHPMWGGDDEP